MLPLRYSTVWSLLGWMLVFIVIAVSLLPGPAVVYYSLIDKIAHAFSYCLLMVWFAGLYTRQRHMAIAFTLVAQGAVLEVIQARLPYRSFDTLDLLANIAGIALGLSLSFLFLAGWCVRVEQLLRIRA